jgi:preprotein translocase subunit SecG
LLTTNSFWRKKLAYFLYGLFFVSCLVLIGAVLLQPGKTDAGALFTSNISSTSFTPRGAASVLSKLTIISATCFMLSALLLSMPGLTGNISVLQTTGDSSETVPVVESNANTATDSNTAADANANTAAVPSTGNANSAAVPANSEVKPAESKADEAKPDAKPEEKKPEPK